MNKLPYRHHHLLALLELYGQQTHPLDRVIGRYFRAHPALGSKDRAFVADAVYALVRWRGLLDYLLPAPSWEERYRAFLEADLEALQRREDIPIALRMGFPQSLFDLLVGSYGLQRACELCLISNEPAPATVRVNALKTTREKLLADWLQEGYAVSPTAHSPLGIVFHKKLNFFQLPAFREGLFEVQDEGSQLLAQLVRVEPGQQVLDYCAGSGGKTLAFAPSMGQKGQIYLHDIRPSALREARKRLRRAGIQNAQFLEAASPRLSRLKKKMDWVLVDAPCSGTGTLRRNPDMKWSFTSDGLARQTGSQRSIFEKALSFLHPEGRVVYATCSLLQEENQAQVDHFISTYSLEVEGVVFQTLPISGGMDGFFGAVLKRRI